MRLRVFLVAALLIVVLAGFTTNSMLAGSEAAKAPQVEGTLEASEKGNSEIVRIAKAVVNSENVLKEANSPPDEVPERNIAGQKPGAIASEVDFARIHPLGTSVIAGVSTPKSRINILADGKVIATVKTGSIGEWVLVTTYNFERAKPNLEVRSPNSPGLSETSKAEPPIPKTASARSAKSDTSLPIDASAKPTFSHHPNVGATRSNLDLLVKNQVRFLDIKPRQKPFPLTSEKTIDRGPPDVFVALNISHAPAKKQLSTSNVKPRNKPSLMPLKRDRPAVAAAPDAPDAPAKKLKAQVRDLAFKLKEQERNQRITSKSQQDAHQAEIRSLRNVHAAEVAKLHVALNAVRKQLNAKTVSRVDQMAPKSCQEVATVGARQSSAYSACSAERARLLTELQRCEIAQRVRSKAIRSKRISAVAKRCGLSKKMILELNR